MKKRVVARSSQSLFNLLFVLTFLLLSICPASARILNKKTSADVDTVKSVALTPEQAIKRKRISDLNISHDGTQVAFTVTDPVKGSDRKSNIWIFSIKPRELTHLTTSRKSDHSPRFSPDGDKLAFLSNRYKTTQIFIISIHGGEAEPLTQSETGIRSFKWSPDGSKIAFLSSDPKTEEEKKKIKERGDAVVVDKDIRDPRLRVINIQSRDVVTLTKEKLRISEFVWLPDGEHLLISATDNPRRDLISNRLYLLNIKNKEMEEIETPRGPFRRLDVSKDGKTLAYLGARTEDGPSAYDLYIRPLRGGRAVNLTKSSINRLIYSYHWKKDGSFLVLAATGFTTTFYNVSKNGKAERLKDFAVYPSYSFASYSRIIAFVGETATKPPELWISTHSGSAEQVTHFNNEWEKINLAEPEIFQYKSFDGMKIEAALYKPLDYKKGERIPLIVLIHGGPTARWSHRFHSWTQLLATRGYAVLCPNIRGSTGYGHEFMISNRYDWGGGDWKDVISGVDFVINQGIADPERVGIGGWSYGGYMAAWAVTQTNRFKTSVSGAPMTDLASEFGTESNGVNIGDTWALGTPYENLGLFIKRSPVTYVKNVKTPTLLLCGERDSTDPIGQCQQFYRGLRRYGVETEFVKYPRMGHGAREEKQQIDIMKRMIEWFDRYLK